MLVACDHGRYRESCIVNRESNHEQRSTNNELWDVCKIGVEIVLDCVDGYMYIFYWYALTPNSIGGLPASYAPISGAAPL
jgi:hypothetical protein